jgi:hypothetical protein
MGRNKRRGRQRSQTKRRIFTARRLTVGSFLLGVLGLIAAIIDPSLAQRFWRQPAPPSEPERRPSVTVDLRASTAPQRDEAGVRATFQVSAQNTGNKAVEYFYWHLMVPFDAVESAEYRQLSNNAFIAPTKEITADKNQTRMLHFQGYFDKPLPAIGMVIGTLSLHIKPKAGPVHVGWQLLCCDDMIFPENFPEVPTANGITVAKLGWLRINPNALKRWDVIKTLPLPTEKELADWFAKTAPQ